MQNVKLNIYLDLNKLVLFRACKLEYKFSSVNLPYLLFNIIVHLFVPPWECYGEIMVIKVKNKAFLRHSQWLFVLEKLAFFARLLLISISRLFILFEF